MSGSRFVGFTCVCLVALQISYQHCMLQIRQRKNLLCRCLRDTINCNAYAQKRLSYWKCNFSCRENQQRPSRSLSFGPVIFDIIKATLLLACAKKDASDLNGRCLAKIKFYTDWFNVLMIVFHYIGHSRWTGTVHKPLNCLRIESIIHHAKPSRKEIMKSSMQ